MSCAADAALRPVVRTSGLSARIHAGNTSSAHGDIPMPTSSTTAQASPATGSHRDTIGVRRAMATVTNVKTAAIRIAHRLNRFVVEFRFNV